jgi:hypothetical protein
MKNFPNAMFNISKNNDVFYSSMDNIINNIIIDRSFLPSFNIEPLIISQTLDFGGRFLGTEMSPGLKLFSNSNYFNNDFTIEFRCRFDEDIYNDINLLQIDNYYFYIKYDLNNFKLFLNNKSTIYVFNNISYDVCICRKFNLLFIFIDGVKLLSFNTSDLDITPPNLSIRDTSKTIHYYLKNIRISKICRYIDNYYPNTNSLPIRSAIVNINSGKSTRNDTLSDDILNNNSNLLQISDSNILYINNINNPVLFSDFTIEFWVYIPDILKSYILLSSSLIHNSWSIQIINKKLVWKNSDTCLFSDLDIQIGWNHIIIMRKDLTIYIYLNINKQSISLFDSEQYLLLNNQISLGHLTGYTRDAFYKNFKINVPVIYTFNMPITWNIDNINNSGPFIYFKIGYINTQTYSYSIDLQVDVYKTELSYDDKFINYENIISSDINIINVNPNFNECILTTKISEFETTSHSDMYSLLITRKDLINEDFKVIYIKSVLTPDITYKQKPTTYQINYSNINLIDNKTLNYSINLITDNGKIFNSAVNNIKYYLPELSNVDNYKQVTFISYIGKNTSIYLPNSLGIYKSCIYTSNMIQFVSYNNNWIIISNIDWKFYEIL